MDKQSIVTNASTQNKFICNILNKHKLLILITISLLLLTVIAFIVIQTPFRVAQKIKQIEGNISKVNKELYYCPSIPEFCKNGEADQKNHFSGNIPKEAPLYASFDGILIEQQLPPIKGESYKYFFILNTQQNLEMSYYFHGDIIKAGGVKKGELIARSNGKSLGFLNNKSFSIMLIKITGNNREPVLFSKKDFILSK